MTADWTRTLGRTGVTVSAITAGTSPLGGRVERNAALRTLRRVFESPITTIDTANEYSDGASESLIGELLLDDHHFHEMTVLTKVDRGTDGRFDRSRVRDSYTESLDRLGMATVPVLFLHDPHKMALTDNEELFSAITAPDGPLAGLIALRDEGRVASIGIAGGSTPLMLALMRTGEFDACLTHNRFTLVDRSAEPLLDYAQSIGAGVLNAAVFGGKILATGPSKSTTYAYREANPAVLAATVAMEDLCTKSDIPLAAAALQFSLRDTRIHTTVVGFSTPRQVEDTLNLIDVDIPDSLWGELSALLPAPEHWVDGKVI